jgi:hypothetical protein
MIARRATFAGTIARTRKAVRPAGQRVLLRTRTVLAFDDARTVALGLPAHGLRLPGSVPGFLASPPVIIGNSTRKYAINQ